MDVLYNKVLRKHNGEEVKVEDHLIRTKIIIFFFSAAHVQKTDDLIERLKVVYEENKKRQVGMEIIFVSADTELEAFETYVAKQGPWVSVPFKSVACDELRWRYDITCMPQVIVCKVDGTVISNKGKSELEKLGVNVLVTWSEFVQH